MFMRSDKLTKLVWFVLSFCLVRDFSNLYGLVWFVVVEKTYWLCSAIQKILQLDLTFKLLRVIKHSPIWIDLQIVREFSL